MTAPSFARLARRSLNLWIGAFFLIPGTVLFVTGIQEGGKGRRVRRERVEAQATVLSKSIDRARREENLRTRYLATVRFTVGETPIERTEEIEVEEWEGLAEGGTTLVRYLLSDPADAAAANPGEAWVAWMMAALGVTFDLIGFLLVVPAFRRIRLVRRIHREGEAAEGKVLEVWATGTVVNRVRQWRLRYEFQSPLGRVERGESDLLPPEEALRWKPGDVGAIRFDPVRPETSIWVSEPPESIQPRAEALSPGRGRRRPLRVTAAAGVGIALAFVCAVLAELPPIEGLVELVDRHRSTLLVPVVGVLSLGFLLFMGGVLALLFEQGEPMTHSDVENQARSVRFGRRPAAWRASTYRLRGKGAGVAGEDRFTFAELKHALRSGLVRRDPVWRRRLVVVIGGLSTSLGLMGVFVVIGPPWVKVLFAAASIFALFSFLRGFLRA